jgi:proline dehydrogenase
MLLRTLILKVSAIAWVERFVRKSRMLRPMVKRFIGGDTLADGLCNSTPLLDRGFLISLDLLGESVHSVEEANSARDSFLEIIEKLSADPHFVPYELKSDSSNRFERIENINISIKLTQCGLDISDELAEENFRRVLALAKEKGTMVRVDMEASAYTERTIAMIERVFSEFPNAGTVLQSYLFRTPEDLCRLNKFGCRLRLVKGAYLEPNEIAFEKKEQVNSAYIELAKTMLEHTNYPAFATQDPNMIEAVKSYAAEHSIDKSRFEFQMLFGIRRDLQDALLGEGYRVRVYVPFGDSWYPYFSRRLAERPANVWFILKALFRR